MVDSDNLNLNDPFDYLLQTHTNDEALSIIGDMVNHGGIPLDSEALRLSGCYAHIARTAKMLSAIQAELPKLIIESGQVNEHIHKRNTDNYLSAFDLLQEKDAKSNEKLVSIIFTSLETHLLALEAQVKKIDEGILKLQKDADSIVKKSIFNQRDLSAYLLFGAIGLLVGSISIVGIYQFVVMPKQLTQMRGGDAAILDWFSTPDGKIMYNTYKAGNKSVKACAKQEIDKTGKKKIRCDISFYL
jgi:hypothetical protein